MMSVARSHADGRRVERGRRRRPRRRSRRSSAAARAIAAEQRQPLSDANAVAACPDRSPSAAAARRSVWPASVEQDARRADRRPACPAGSGRADRLRRERRQPVARASARRTRRSRPRPTARSSAATICTRPAVCSPVAPPASPLARYVRRATRFWPTVEAAGRAAVDQQLVARRVQAVALGGAPRSDRAERLVAPPGFAGPQTESRSWSGTGCTTGRGGGGSGGSCGRRRQRRCDEPSPLPSTITTSERGASSRRCVGDRGVGVGRRS